MESTVDGESLECGMLHCKGHKTQCTTHTCYNNKSSCRMFWLKGKGKLHSRIGHEGPEREKWYSSTLSLTSALDGVWVVKAMPWPLYPQERTGIHCIDGWEGPRASLDRFWLKSGQFCLLTFYHRIPILCHNYVNYGHIFIIPWCCLPATALPVI